MPSQHKHPPIPFRPPEGDRSWLLEHAKRTGKPVNRILAEALAAYRKGLEDVRLTKPGHG
jgi:hypothetical protein